MRYFAVIGLLVIACGAFAFHNDHPQYREFVAYINKYNKIYTTREEIDTRFSIYQESLKKIEKLNAENSTATYAVTKFADMTLEEFYKYPCGGNLMDIKHHNQPQISVHENVEVPASWDWTEHGATTPVKDQKQCGSCWAFSAIGNIEGAWFLGGNNLTSLSEQEIVDCSISNAGCSGGWPYLAMQDMLLTPESGIIETEIGYPYTATTDTCAFNAAKKGALIKSFKSYCTEDTPDCDETNMASLLYSTGPLSACLDASPFQYYSSGIIPASSCNPSNIDHCITIVGYDTDAKTKTPYWKIKNSWGVGWGEQGFVKLTRNDGACGINKVITMAQV